MRHPARMPVVTVTAVVATTLTTPAAPAAGGDCFGQASRHCVVTVEAAPPTWVLLGTERTTRATLERTDRMPAASVDGARVQLRVRPVADGNPWQVLDEATLQPVAGEPDQYAATLTYRFPRRGHLETRVRTFLDGRWFLDRRRHHRVTREMPPHDPQVLSRSVRARGLVMDSSLTRGAWTARSQVHWTMQAFGAGESRSFAGSQPDWADDTRRFVASRTVFSGQQPVGRRVVLVDGRSGRRTPVALDPHGDPVRFSSSPSVDDAGELVAYVSASDAIVPAGPSGPKVFLADTATGTSRLLGRGRSPAISGSARYVAYLTGSGLRLHDRVADTTVEVTSSAPPRLDDLAVADDGLVLWSQQDGRTPKRRSVFYWDGSDVWVLGEGDVPSLSDDGAWVFYPGVVSYGDGSYAGVIRRNPRGGDKETVTFGPTGRDSRTRVLSLNADPTGRYVVVGSDGGPSPLMPNVGAYRSVRFDLDSP